MKQWLYIFFFLSGVAGLAQEIVWTRLFSFVFGGTHLSIATVLTSFMMGLALGSYGGGFFSKTSKHPLWVYGFLEIFVGLWGFALPWMVSFLPSLLVSSNDSHSSLNLALIRFLISLALLLPPTVAMGATFPFVSKWVLQKVESPKVAIGWIYTLNLSGAVLGCLLSGFWILPLFGLLKTLYFFSALNLVVGILACFFFHKQEVAEDKLPHDVTSKPLSLVSFVFCFSFLSGFFSMALQIAWSRVLSIVIGASVYSFSLILSSFLLGLSLGAAFVARWIRKQGSNSNGLLLSMFGAFISLFLGSLYLDHLPLLFFKVVQGQQLSASFLFFVKFCLTGWVVFLPTFFMGMAFPFLIQLSFDLEVPSSQTIGKLYSINTIGSITGSFLTGFFFLPALGTQNILLVSTCFFGSSFLFFWFKFRLETSQSWVKIIALLVGVLACVILVQTTPRWNQNLLTLGLFRISVLKRTFVEHLKQPLPVVFHQDGLNATVSVVQWKKQIGLKVNGKTDASNGADMPTQVLSGVLPVWLHPHPKKALVIGWGSGVTVGAVLESSIEKVDAIELESAVLEGAKYFGPYNHFAWKNPKLNLIVNDGRNYIMNTSRKYDVIISEPSNPWMTGISSLFTYEFFQGVSKRLNHNGLLCQWVQFYELSPKNIRSILHAVKKVFPHVLLFSPSFRGNDNLLLASNQPFSFDLKILQKKMQSPRWKKELGRAGILDAMDLLPRLVARQQDLVDLTRDAPLNTDDNALVEFSAPLELLTYYQSDSGDSIRKLLKHPWDFFTSVFPIPSKEKEKKATYYLQVALAMFRFGDKKTAQKSYKRSLTFLSQPSQQHFAFLRLQKTVEKGDVDFYSMYPEQRTLRNVEKLKECWSPFGNILVDKKEIQQAIQNKDRAKMHLLRGLLLFEQQKWDLSLNALEQIKKRDVPKGWKTGLHYLLSRLYLRKKEWSLGVYFSELYLYGKPDFNEICVFKKER